jgi:hypothetical protein
MPRPQTALEFLDASYRQNAAALPNAEFRSVSVTRGLYNALVDELGVMERFGNAIIHERYMFRGSDDSDGRQPSGMACAGLALGGHARSTKSSKSACSASCSRSARTGSSIAGRRSVGRNVRLNLLPKCFCVLY